MRDRPQRCSEKSWMSKVPMVASCNCNSTRLRRQASNDFVSSAPHNISNLSWVSAEMPSAPSGELTSSFMYERSCFGVSRLWDLYWRLANVGFLWSPDLCRVLPQSEHDLVNHTTMLSKIAPQIAHQDAHAVSSSGENYHNHVHCLEVLVRILWQAHPST